MAAPAVTDPARPPPAAPGCRGIRRQAGQGEERERLVRPRKAPPPTPAAGTPWCPLPGHGGPSGGPGASAAGRAGSGPSTPRGDLPYFSDGPPRTGGQDASRPGRSALDAFDADTPGPRRPAVHAEPAAPTPGPAGPTTGPATGSSSLTPNLDGIPGMGGGPMGPGGPAGPRGPGGSGPGGPVARVRVAPAQRVPVAPARAAPGRTAAAVRRHCDPDASEPGPGVRSRTCLR
ncbi:hypothetical protein NKH18_33575 [Streptomyces sp. M10(2022)]